MIHSARIASAVIAGTLLATSGAALANPLAPGWDLSNDASSISFQSIKNGSKVETSTFATIKGAIEADGSAEITIPLDAIDTGIDLRNVRMRFLFFETFSFPEATITATIDPAILEQLPTKRRMTATLPFEMTLHGVTKPLETNVVVTLITDEMVSVASAAPVAIPVDLFGMTEGLTKLEEAAGVTITPQTSVNFDFVFNSRGGAEEIVTAAAAPVAEAGVEAAAPVEPAPVASAALEPEGDFSREACEGRFEIISQTGSIYFRSGSAELSPESDPFLAAIIDIVERCPGLDIEVSGHTDSVGDEEYNQRLSEDRAASVVSFLTRNGVDSGRISSVGFGELRPIADNDTKRGRWRNRRIEFAVDSPS